MMNLFRRKRSTEPAPAAAADAAQEERAGPEGHSYEPWRPDEAAPAPASEATASQAPSPDAPADPAERPAPDASEAARLAEPAAHRPLDDVAPGSVEANVVEALKKVYDPEIPVNIFELGLIYGVDVSDAGSVAVTMTLTTPGCPVAEQMPGMVEHAILDFVPEAREVDVDIVWDPPWNPSMMSDAAKLELGFY